MEKLKNLLVFILLSGILLGLVACVKSEAARSANTANSNSADGLALDIGDTTKASEKRKSQKQDKSDSKEQKSEKQAEGENMENLYIDKIGTPGKAEIYLAAGCFWGTEAYFKRVQGILETEVGYANGKSKETSYRELSDTGHAETLKITYNPHKIHLAEILERFYRIIDPYSINKQGNDYGTQYRSGIYFTDKALQDLINYSVKNFEEIAGKKTAIEVAELKNYVSAEDYHQDYLDKNPGGYCHINTEEADAPLFPGEDLPSEEKLKEILEGLAYKVARESATEMPHSSALDQEFSEGIYVDVATGEPLFSSADKFDAGCGWPSFTMPITTDVLAYYGDDSYGMQRIEVKARSTNHLGHVFEDGPKANGSLRYCINGIVLRFIPLENMDEAGYAALKPFVFKK